MGSLAPMSAAGQSGASSGVAGSNGSGRFPGMGNLGTPSSSLGSLGGAPMNNPWQPSVAPQAAQGGRGPATHLLGEQPPPGLPPMLSQHQGGGIGFGRLNSLDPDNRKQVENTLLSFLE